jgi:signal peptidase I
MKGSRERSDFPTIDQLQVEEEKSNHRRRIFSGLRTTIGAIIVVAAIAVLIATIWMPVLKIQGTSMTPTLTEGNIVLSLKGSKFETGDLVAFYMGNKLLVKRCIAGPGDWVDIDEDGNVFVNGELLDEPYISEKSLGECDMTFPYQVPESKYFMLGDHRATSMDSRSNSIGCVSEEQIVGRVVFRIWPLGQLGLVD